MTQLSKTIEEKLKTLRERYSPQPVPKCHICGAEMTVQRMSASRITYGCTGATYDDVGCHYATGRSIADDHYEQSRVTVVDVSDPDVLELIDSLKAAPQPVAVPDEWTIQDAVKFCKETGRQDAGAAMDAWNACRSAMLNAEPVSQPYKLPDGWKLVPVEPTAEMYDAGDQQLATKQVWDAMLAAAPQEPTK